MVDNHNISTWSESIPPQAKVSVTSSLSVIYLNARSLVNKINLLRSYALTYKPSIICVTETWANSNLPNAYFHIESFNIYRCDRSSSRGGGVMMYVTQKIKSCLRNDFSIDNVEAITCEIILNDGSLLFSCVYVPPRHTWCRDSFIHYLYSICDMKSSHNVICGDFNRPDINWSSDSICLSNDVLISWFMDNHLYQNVNVVTRPQSGTILDLIFSSIGTCVSNPSVSEMFGKSDHLILSFCIEHEPRKVRQYLVIFLIITELIGNV